MNKFWSSLIGTKGAALLWAVVVLPSPAVNPLLPPDVFIPDVEARVFSNGKGEKRLYLYGSCDEYPPTGWCSWKYRVFSAPLADLEKWTDHGVSFASRKGEGYRWKGEEADGILWSDRRLYAPDVLFFEGRYWLVSCLDGGGLGMSVSDRPEGPFSPAAPILYDKTPPGENRALPSIDPALLTEDGKLYLFWGQNAAWKKPNECGGLQAVELKKDDQGIYSVARLETRAFPFGTKEEPDQGFGFYEGPSVRRINGKYYILYPSSKVPGTLHTMSYAIADKPLGPYRFGGNILSNEGADREKGNNHGSLCEVGGKWYLFYHRGFNGNCSRKVCVEPLNIQPDGTIDPVLMTNHGFGSSPSPYRKTGAELATRVRVPGFQGGCHLHEESRDLHPLVNITNGNCVEYRDFDFGQKGKAMDFFINFKPMAGGSIELVWDDPSAEVAGTVEVPASEAGKWTELRCPVKPAKGVHVLYLRFKAGHAKKIGEMASFRFEQKK